MDIRWLYLQHFVPIYAFLICFYSGNIPAKKAYEQAGFEGYELDATAGFAEFWQKKIVF